MTTLTVGAVKLTNILSDDPNTLDWYEEGDWIPVLSGVTSAGAGTYASRSGKYTRVGRILHFQGIMDISNHTGTGFAKITGLPYWPSNDQGFFCCLFNNYTFTRSSPALYYRAASTSFEVWSGGSGVSWGQESIDSVCTMAFTGALQL